VRVSSTTDPGTFLTDRFLRHVSKQKRGVAVFVPTRAGTEKIAAAVTERWPELFAEFYHGGEPVAKLRPFLEEEGSPRPFVLSMTSAGQSALNIRGLDTVVIEDAQFTTLVKKGKGVLTRLPLGANEILQMAGRVHGRVRAARCGSSPTATSTSRRCSPPSPTSSSPATRSGWRSPAPTWACAPTSWTCRCRWTASPTAASVELLEARGLIENNRLTHYGREVEVLPVDRPWGELLVRADEHLVPVVATCASIESLHRMLRQEHEISRFIVPGSDHLTAYNLYRAALEACGTMGSVYGLPRHVFEPEALESVGGGARRADPQHRGRGARHRLHLPRDGPAAPAHAAEAEPQDGGGWQRLVAEVMPFDLVIDEETSWGEEVKVSRSSVCGTYGAVAGQLRYFSDKNGRTRGSIEGTQLPLDLVWEAADPGPAQVRYDPAHRREPLRLLRERAYHGFVLDSEEEPVNRFPNGLEDECRRVLAEAVASGTAQHPEAGRSAAPSASCARCTAAPADARRRSARRR
jgi:ATP-dependent helicase HrpA